MKKECFNCKWSIDFPDCGDPEDGEPCNSCENHDKWQPIKENKDE